MEPPPGLPEEARQWLLERQKELERDFADRMRELKMQHRRKLDALEEDRAAWESWRRQQAQAIADKAETVRRRVAVQQEKVEVSAAVHKELEERRAQVRQLEAAERAWGRERRRLDARLEAAQARARTARARAGAAAAVLAAGALGWLALRPDPRAAWAPLAASVLACALLLWMRRGWGAADPADPDLAEPSGPSEPAEPGAPAPKARA